MIVNVTEKHIANGVKLDCRRCPVALALRDAFPNAYVEVDFYHLQINYECRETSATIRRFMNDFDFSRNPTPFSFDFDALKP